MIGAFIYLDITPKGRNESEIMDWVRRHDEYEAPAVQRGEAGQLLASLFIRAASIRSARAKDCRADEQPEAVAALIERYASM